MFIWNIVGIHIVASSLHHHHHYRSPSSLLLSSPSDFNMMNNNDAPHSSPSLLFPNALPRDRLGQEHASLESFQQAVAAQHDQISSINNNNFDTNMQPTCTRKQKEYSLVVVIEPETQRILLGKKLRGFGIGFYNSFGGKIEVGETDAQSAVRELQEETGISLLSSKECFDMVQHKVGTMHFTFQDDLEIEMMIVHVFCIHVTCCHHVNDNNMDSNKQTVSSLSSMSGIIPTMIHLDPSIIRGCDEITPIWFDDWYNIPLHEMFADDSIWLTRLLLFHHHHHQQRDDGDNSSSRRLLTMDGWFHFAAGGQQENRILHYYLNVKTHDSSCITNSPSDNRAAITSSNGMKHQQFTDTDNETNNTSSSTATPSCSINNKSGDIDSISSSSSPPFTLEKRLFHRLHDNQIRSPSIKEFKESWAFCNIVRGSFMLASNKKEHDEQDSPSSVAIDLVIDVAGGHGALAALFLILTSAQRAIVIDPAQVGGGSVVRAWSDFFYNNNNNEKTLEYRHECLRIGLPAVLKNVIYDKGIDPRRILVVACHACQHLSDEVLAIACGRFGVHAAVMPCCQKDSNGYWKSVAKKMNVPIAIVMDILLAGKVSTWPVHDSGQQQQEYDVRIKLLDQSITPQNRLILCRAIGNNSPSRTSSTRMLRRQDNEVVCRNETIDKAHEKLERTYRRAHDNIIKPKKKDEKQTDFMSFAIVSATNAVRDLLNLTIQQKQQVSMLITGFCLGMIVAQTCLTRSDRDR